MGSWFSKKKTRSRTARPSCSQPTARSYSSTGQPLVQASPVSPSSWSSSSCWPSATRKIGAPTGEPDVPSCTTFCTQYTEGPRPIPRPHQAEEGTQPSPPHSQGHTPGSQCRWQPWRPWSATQDHLQAPQQPSSPPARCSKCSSAQGHHCHTVPTMPLAEPASQASTAPSPGETNSGQSMAPPQPETGALPPNRQPSPCPVPGNRRKNHNNPRGTTSRRSPTSPAPSHSRERPRSFPSAGPNPWQTSIPAHSPPMPSPASTRPGPPSSKPSEPAKTKKKDSNIFRKVFYMTSF